MSSTPNYQPLNNHTIFHFDHIFFDDPQTFGEVCLYQIGDLSCEGGYVVKEHNQFCYEISFIVSGKGYFRVGDRDYEVKSGDIILNLPGKAHACKADNEDPFRYFYMGFSFVNQRNEETGSLVHIQKMFDQTVYPIVMNKFGIDQLFRSIFKELVNLKKYSSYMIGMYLQQLIILTYRSYYDNWEEIYSPLMQEKKISQLTYDVIRYIDKYLYEIVELFQIAENVHYSYSYVSHHFSREVGLTIKEYYNQKRFEEAVKLLRTSELTITEIADKLHYQSIQAFSRAFKKNFGISPTEYKIITIRNNM